MMKTTGYSRPFALCSVISVTRPSSSLARVGVGDERDLLEEDVEPVVARARRRRRTRARPRRALAGSPPALGLDRALGLERVQVAALVQDRLEQVADRARPARARSRSAVIVSMKRPIALTAAEPRPGTAAGSAAASQMLMPIVLACAEHARERRLADAAPRRVRDALEADGVLRVGEQRQVGDRVLDLGALVELRAADDLVADLAPHERVLEHPRLRVHPVEDRDLRAREPLVDEPLDLAGDVARLGVLVVELADDDLVALAQRRSTASSASAPRLCAMTAFAASRIVCVER